MQKSGGGDRRRCERGDCICPGGAVEGDRLKVEVTESDKGVLSFLGGHKGGQKMLYSAAKHGEESLQLKYMESYVK